MRPKKFHWFSAFTGTRMKNSLIYSLRCRISYYLDMQYTRNNSWIYPIGRSLAVAAILFASSGNALAYGGYHYGHGYHHYGYHGHYGFGAHYSSHGGIGTAGYVILGLFGAVLLSHILSDRDDRYRGVYQRSPANQQPVTYHPPAPPPIRYSAPVYRYESHEGWEALSGGNARFALDIFAIQTQEDMGNGVPRIGFALAAAANGELDRGARAMRKALSIDPYALSDIQVTNELRLIIDLLSEEYAAAIQHNDLDFDNSFMVATLAYLKQDYSTASKLISNADQSQSANNLREMLSVNL
jgi:hypothetical protein